MQKPVIEVALESFAQLYEEYKQGDITSETANTALLWATIPWYWSLIGKATDARALTAALEIATHNGDIDGVYEIIEHAAENGILHKLCLCIASNELMENDALLIDAIRNVAKDYNDRRIV